MNYRQAIEIATIFFLLHFVEDASTECQWSVPYTITCENTSLENYLYDVLKSRNNYEYYPKRKSANPEYGFYFLDEITDIKILNSYFPEIGNFLVGSRYIRTVTINFCGTNIVEKNAFKHLDDMLKLDLAFNNIDNLDFLDTLSNSLSTLNVSHNKIMNLNFEHFPKNLLNIDLSFNRIKVLIMTHFNKGNAFLFDVSYNNISTVIIASTLLTEDLKLNIAHNNLQHFQFIEIGIPKAIKMLNVFQSVSNISILKEITSYIYPETLVATNNNISTSLNVILDSDYTKNIDYSNCSLTNLNPVTFKDKQLHTVNLSYNSLKLFNKGVFIGSEIRNLDLSGNKIEFLDRAFQYGQFGRLNLKSNRISELDATSFTKIRKVTWLNLSYNKNLRLGNNSFGQCIGLEVLVLSFCNLTWLDSLAFNGSTSLKTLNMSHNNIISLQYGLFIPLQRIKAIDLSYNRIGHVKSHTFDSLYQLEWIDLSTNNIQTIESSAFSNLKSLSSVKINSNYEQRLGICSGAFSSAPHLKLLEFTNSSIENFNLNILNTTISQNLKLSLRWNPLRSINFSDNSRFINVKELSLTFQGPLKAKSFLKLIYLEKLQFSNSNISVIEANAFQGLYQLESIQFRDSQVGRLADGALNSLFALREFDRSILKGQQTLGANTFSQMYLLNRLNLSGLGLTTIQPSAFNNLKDLEILDLSFNQISCFHGSTFPSLDNLKVLNLSHNHLVSIRDDEYENLSGLNELRLDGNQISDIAIGALQHFPDLQTLSLAANNLTEFKVGTFSNLQNLKVLDLQGNSISVLLFESFVPLKSLTTLRLESNNLKVIGHIQLVSNLKYLRRIGIARNKWKCDYLGDILATFRNYSIDYSSDSPNFHDENVEGIRCIDICKYLYCLKNNVDVN